MRDMYIVRELYGQAIEFTPAGGAPQLSWLGLLLRFALRSYFSPLIVLSFLFALGVIAKKWPYKVVEILAAMFALGVMLVPSVYWFASGSVTMFNFAVGFVMVSTVFILNFVKLTILDYAIMFSCFAYLYRFVGVARSVSRISTNFGLSLSALIVMVTVLAIYKIRLGQLKGNLFFCWFTCMLVFIKGYIANFIFLRYINDIGRVQATRIEALFVWGAALLVAFGIIVLLIYAIKRLFKKHIDNINRMGKAYPLIERFIILNSIGIFVLMGTAHYFFGMTLLRTDYVYGLVVLGQNPILSHTNLILLFAMTLQLSFIIMVFRITWLKDNLRATAMENQSLAVYSSNLEKSIDDIKNIKHDVKNIFLTMGNFVERSGDIEMQEFYSKKISPFAVDEIAKNDLLGKLAGLGNEQLKAFMYYKISQAIELDVDVVLDIATQVPDFDLNGDFTIEFIDLVRILGILLDNAIEECVEIPGGQIFIKISRNDEMLSFVIKNTVRPEIKDNGIKPGTSTKGEDRGKGLVGIRNIIGKYDMVLLNSYFSEGCFVQSLVVHTNPLAE